MTDLSVCAATQLRRDSLRYIMSANFEQSHKGLPSRSCNAAKAGGAKRDRTADLLHAMQALSQLSYGPIP
jgi:hypothetical protein